MIAEPKIREVVESVVAEAFDAHVRTLHDEVVRRVIQALEPLLGSQLATRPLQSAIERLERASTQSGILESLLDGTAQFAGRVALFVLRGPTAVGWDSRGFRDSASVKTASVDLSSGLAARASRDRSPVCGPEAQFCKELPGVSGTAECVVVPLLVREKVVALLYADSGREQQRIPDSSCLAILAHAAGNWIELSTVRRVAKVAPAQDQATAATESTPHPSAGVAPAAAADINAGAQTNATSVSSAISTCAIPSTSSSAVVSPEPAPSTHSESAGESNGNDEFHRRARRFAKLLVDEIILYNREKVTAGKLGQDLYDRLKDDVDKSRLTYEKRYGHTPDASDYFTKALIAGLADHNPVLMGPNFPR